MVVVFVKVCAIRLHFRCGHAIVSMVETMQGCNYFEETNITVQDSELLKQNMSKVWRGIFRDFVVGIMRTFEDFDFSLPQLAALLLLEEEGELTIKRVAELLKRSVSATSRLLDQLVVRGLVSRHEDERDRRAKLVALTEAGRVFMEMVEQQRVERQISAMRHLSDEEREEVTRVMVLLAEVGKNSESENT